MMFVIVNTGKHSDVEWAGVAEDVDGVIASIDRNDPENYPPDGIALYRMEHVTEEPYASEAELRAAIGALGVDEGLELDVAGGRRRWYVKRVS